MMTGVNRIFSYFPLLMTVLSIVALGVFAKWPSVWSMLLLALTLYGLPPMVLRILLRWTPIASGVSTIDDRTFSPWLASHHIQAFYDALPYLESLLRVIPGFYSLWLRMWGARIGYGVEWPVRMDVLDRNLLEVGNRVVFAREVEMASHVRKKTEGGASRVLVRPVRIGGYSFIGAASRIGPGANIPANANVPERTIVDVNETFGETARLLDKTEADFALS